MSKHFITSRTVQQKHLHWRPSVASVFSSLRDIYVIAFYFINNETLKYQEDIKLRNISFVVCLRGDVCAKML